MPITRNIKTPNGHTGRFRSEPNILNVYLPLSGSASKLVGLELTVGGLELKILCINQ